MLNDIFDKVYDVPSTATAPAPAPPVVATPISDVAAVNAVAVTVDIAAPSIKTPAGASVISISTWP